MGAACLYAALLLASGVATANAACPHEDGIFEKWSDPSTWENGKVTSTHFVKMLIILDLTNNSTLQVPIDDQVVTINKHILLDTVTARLGGVDIQNGGRLVFSPGNIISPILHSFSSQIN